MAMLDDYNNSEHQIKFVKSIKHDFFTLFDEANQNNNKIQQKQRFYKEEDI